MGLYVEPIFTLNLVSQYSYIKEMKNGAEAISHKTFSSSDAFRSFDQEFGIFLHIYCKMFFKPRDAGDNVP